MADKFRAGEEWTSQGGMGRGKVKKKLTQRTLIKGHAVAAPSQDKESGDPYADYDPREPQQLIDPAEQSDG